MTTSMRCLKPLVETPLQLEIWDTAGQEALQHLRACAYPDTDVFLIAYDMAGGASLDNVLVREKAPADVKPAPGFLEGRDRRPLRRRRAPPIHLGLLTYCSRLMQRRWALSMTFGKPNGMMKSNKKSGSRRTRYVSLCATYSGHIQVAQELGACHFVCTSAKTGLMLC